MNIGFRFASREVRAIIFDFLTANSMNPNLFIALLGTLRARGIAPTDTPSADSLTPAAEASPVGQTPYHPPSENERGYAERHANEAGLEDLPEHVKQETRQHHGDW
jgi:hypothetical protein